MNNQYQYNSNKYKEHTKNPKYKDKKQKLHLHQSYLYMHGSYPIFLRYIPGWVKMLFLPESRVFRNHFREYPLDMVRTNGGLSFFLLRYIFINSVILLICEFYFNEFNPFLYTQYIIIFFIIFSYIYRSFKLYLQNIIKIKYIADENVWPNRFFLLIMDKISSGKRYIIRTYPNNISFCLYFLYDKSIPKLKKNLFLLYLILMLYCTGSYLLDMLYSLMYVYFIGKWCLIYFLKKNLFIIWYHKWIFLIKYTIYWLFLYLFMFVMCFNSIFEFQYNNYLERIFNYNEMLNSTVCLVALISLYVIYGPWWMFGKKTGIILIMALFPNYNYFSFIDM